MKVRDRNVEVKPQRESRPLENPFAGCYFNIRCEGNIIFYRVRARYFQGLRPNVITMAWCMDQRRELTRKEIEKLCSAGRPKEENGPPTKE